MIIIRIMELINGEKNREEVSVQADEICPRG